MEFVREIQTNFNRWCTASGVKTLSDLRELVMLEQFKNSVPPRIATYVGEAKVHTAYDAAGLADEFALMHKINLDKKMSKMVDANRIGLHMIRVGKMLISAGQDRFVLLGKVI